MDFAAGGRYLKGPQAALTVDTGPFARVVAAPGFEPEMAESADLQRASSTCPDQALPLERPTLGEHGGCERSTGT